ncbi:MAG: hypothetical protein K5898_13645 [Ruminococcus sp.]|uniref:hypothetical protein n=1 Tax=Ruminococcus sp. TaxID=41978 RepID=UPI0025D8BED2|nr:hypothetical protein [Ruminococcus sp.]MCR4796183.1 hypothetical protein [Ruminococcus sp.]
MAFCKFCGKQIPDGGSCDCAASKAEREVKEKVEKEVGNVQNTAEKAADSVADKAKDTAAELKEKAGDVADKVGDSLKQGATKVDGLAGELSEKLPGGMKNNKSAVYAAAGVILVLIICLICLIFGGGAKGTLKKFIKASSDDKGGKTILSLTLPDSAIDALKDDDKFDKMVKQINNRIEDQIDDLEDDETIPSYEKIIRKEKLTNSQLNAAEDYFSDICEQYDADDDIEVTKGYEFKVRLKYRDEDGKKRHETEKLCVVKIKGDGWKVISSSADSLD